MWAVRLRLMRSIQRSPQIEQPLRNLSDSVVTDSSDSSDTKFDGDARIKSADGTIEYSVSKEDFKWVTRVFPPSRIPFPPKHESYPTPSGWFAPSDTVPEKPYFVNRTKYHIFPIYEEQKPKQSGRWLTMIKNVEGDIKVLEKELIEVVKPNTTFDPATRVNEATQTIWIKGLHKDAIEHYLYKQGF